MLTNINYVKQPDIIMDFIKFTEQLKTSENKQLIESIQSGYISIHESSDEGARNITKEKLDTYKSEMGKHIDALDSLISKYKRDVWYMANDNNQSPSSYNDKYASDLAYTFNEYFLKAFHKNIGALENDIDNNRLPHQK